MSARRPQLDLLLVAKAVATVLIFLLASTLLLRAAGGGAARDTKRLGRVRTIDELYADVGCGTVLAMTVAAGLFTYFAIWVVLRWF